MLLCCREPTGSVQSGQRYQPDLAVQADNTGLPAGGTVLHHQGLAGCAQDGPGHARVHATAGEQHGSDVSSCSFLTFLPFFSSHFSSCTYFASTTFFIHIIFLPIPAVPLLLALLTFLSTLLVGSFLLCMLHRIEMFLPFV